MHAGVSTTASASLAGALLGLLVAGCAEERAPEPTSSSPQAVVAGELSPSGREDAVLLLYTELDGQELLCSSSLVAPNLVLTARHCVSHLVRGLFTCTSQGELKSTDEGAGELGTHLPAASLAFYDARTPRQEPLAWGKEVISTLSETICVNDLAFVVLDRELELPVLPLRLGGRAQRDEAVTLVGYGLDDAMSQTGRLEFETQPRTHNDALTIGDVGPDADEDATTVPPRTILVEGPSGCLGDSGGPLISSETGALLGVYSLLAGSSCLAPNAQHLFGHVPSFVALTDQAFAAADAEPTPEPSVTAGAGRGGGGGESGQSPGGAGEGGAGGAGGDAGVGGRASGGSAGRVAAEPSSEAGAGGVEPAPTPKPAPPHRRAAGCVLAPGHVTGASSLWLAVLGAAFAVRAGASVACRAGRRRRGQAQASRRPA